MKMKGTKSVDRHKLVATVMTRQKQMSKYLGWFNLVQNLVTEFDSPSAPILSLCSPAEVHT